MTPRIGFGKALPAVRSAAAPPAPIGSIAIGRNTITNRLFSLYPEDVGHLHIVGPSGKGKSKLLEIIIRQWMLSSDYRRRAILVFDPHYELDYALLAWIAEYGLDRFIKVRLLDPTDDSFSFGFNPFISNADYDPLVLAQEIATAILTAFGEREPYDKPRTMMALTQICYVLSFHKLTLLEAIHFLFYDDPDGIRAHLVAGLPEEARRFWEQRERAGIARWDEYFESVTTRILPIVQNPSFARIFGQTTNLLDMAAAMDAGEIVLINLKPNRHFSGEAARLLGCLLLREVFLAGRRRNNYALRVGPELAVPACALIDEAQNYFTEDIGRILDQLRKWDVFLGISHQHLAHFRERSKELFSSIATNCLVRAVFGGLEPDDCEYLSRLVFRQTFDPEKLKEGARQPMVVGIKRVLLANESVGAGGSLGVTMTQGRSGSTAHSRNRGHSLALSESESDTENDSASQTQNLDANGDEKGTSTTTSRAGSRAKSRGITETFSDGEGITETDGWSDSLGVTGTASLQLSRGRSQAFEPQYEMRPVHLYSLEEQVTLRAYELGQLPRGELYLQVGTKWPRRIKALTLPQEFVLPELVELVREEILRTTPWVKTVAAADEECRAHREGLRAAAAPAEVRDEPSAFGDLAARLRRQNGPEPHE